MAADSWVTFLSDYGLDDSFVGVCKGVMARMATDVKIIDICHNVAPQDVEHGATALAAALPYLPRGVHLALVDPIKPRTVRGVAVRTADGSVLLGPDNGVTSLGWAPLGGAVAGFGLLTLWLWLY